MTHLKCQDLFSKKKKNIYIYLKVPSAAVMIGASKTGVHYKKRSKFHSVIRGLVVSTLDFQVGYCGFESRLG